MAAYCRVHGLKSRAGWLPVHRDQLRAQRSVTSVGELYIFKLENVRGRCIVSIKVELEVVFALWNGDMAEDLKDFIL